MPTQLQDGWDDAEDDEPDGLDASKSCQCISPVRDTSSPPQSVPGTDDKKEGPEMTMAEKKEAERLRYLYLLVMVRTLAGMWLITVHSGRRP